MVIWLGVMFAESVLCNILYTGTSVWLTIDLLMSLDH